jgi:hypothetical protein
MTLTDKNTRLLGLTITWIEDYIPVFTDITSTDFNAKKLYQTGTIVHVTPVYVKIEFSGPEGKVTKRFVKTDLIPQIEDEVVQDLLTASLTNKVDTQNREKQSYGVYRLRDPRDKVINYVGISKDVARRFRQHCQCYGINLELNLWLQELHALGLLPILETIETVKGFRAAQEHERYWIAYYLKQGAPLKNKPNVFEDFWANIDRETRIPNSNPDGLVDVREMPNKKLKGMTGNE